VDSAKVGLNDGRMSWETSHGFNIPRLWRTLCLLALVMLPATSFALTRFNFAPLEAALTNEIAVLRAENDLSRSERVRLRVLVRAENYIEGTSSRDGKALRRLNHLLHRFSGFDAPLEAVAVNLVEFFNTQYNFVGHVLDELPPSERADNLRRDYRRLAGIAARLNEHVGPVQTSGRYDRAKRRLDRILFRAKDALIVPLPLDLTPDTVACKIDGTTFHASYSSNSMSALVFQATINDEGVVNLTLEAVDSAPNGGLRGIAFSIPNIQQGVFRYSIPDVAMFTNRTDVVLFEPRSSVDSAATSGNFFIGATSTEIYGIFDCEGPDFTITKGRFRISLSSQP
jgi:hypothetical protein